MDNKNSEIRIGQPGIYFAPVVTIIGRTKHAAQSPGKNISATDDVKSNDGSACQTTIDLAPVVAIIGRTSYYKTIIVGGELPSAKS